tara:strand:- start:3487 stop:4047 length:561 start_codon:yes stop_codon:yes gene_type:complete
MNIKVEEILMVIVAFIIGYFLNGIINQNLVEGGVVSNDGVDADKSKAEIAEISLNDTKRHFNTKVEWEEDMTYLSNKDENNCSTFKLQEDCNKNPLGQPSKCEWNMNNNKCIPIHPPSKQSILEMIMTDDKLYKSNAIQCYDNSSYYAKIYNFIKQINDSTNKCDISSPLGKKKDNSDVRKKLENT